MGETNVRLTGPERWALAVSCASVGLVIAAMAALNTALPDVARDSGATQSQLTWIVDGYTLVLACLLLPAGAIGDRYGRRNALLIGLAVFGLASLIPIWLDSPMWLIGARALTGVGAAFVLPATLSILTTSLPVDQRTRAVGVWAAVAGSGGIVGLLGSGLLLEWWSWHSIFIGLAACGLGLFGLAWTVSASREPDQPPIDVVGAVVIAAAVGLLVLGVIEGPERGWLDPWVVTAIAAGICAGALFVVVEQRRRHPLLDVRLFANRAFAVGAASLTLQFLAVFGLFFFLIQYLQLVRDQSPLQSAVAIAPLAVPLIAISAAIPWLMPKVGLRILTTSGIAILGMSLMLLGRLESDSGYPQVLYALLVASVGIGLCTAPATTAIVENTPTEKQGVASAVNDATREIGAAVGIALSGSLLAASYTSHIEPAVRAAPPAARGPISDSLASALQFAHRAGGPQADQLAEFAKDAFMKGMQTSSVVMAGVLIASAVVLGIWSPGRRERPSTPPGREPHTSTDLAQKLPRQGSRTSA